jgi:hypothetical protein
VNEDQPLEEEGPSATIVAPVGLTIEAPHEISSGETVAVSAVLGHDDGSVVDVTHQVTWTLLSGEYPVEQGVRSYAATLSSDGTLVARSGLAEAVRLNIVATFDHAVEFQAVHALTVLPVESMADADSFLEELSAPVDDIRRCGRGFGIVAFPACIFMLSASYFRPFSYHRLRKVEKRPRNRRWTRA